MLTSKLEPLALMVLAVFPLQFPGCLPAASGDLPEGAATSDYCCQPCPHLLQMSARGPPMSHRLSTASSSLWLSAPSQVGAAALSTALPSITEAPSSLAVPAFPVPGRAGVVSGTQRCLNSPLHLVHSVCHLAHWSAPPAGQTLTGVTAHLPVPSSAGDSNYISVPVLPLPAATLHLPAPGWAGDLNTAPAPDLLTSLRPEMLLLLRPLFTRLPSLPLHWVLPL